MEKPVWSVRLSPDGALLAVAGYDCKLSLTLTLTRTLTLTLTLTLTRYDCKLSLFQAHPPFELLQEIKHTSSVGPAFIWTCRFSRDGGPAR